MPKTKTPANAALKPALILGVLLLMTAFGFGLFFEGYRDINYAPAIIAILIIACFSILPACWEDTLIIPKAPPAIAMAVFVLYVTLSLSWSSVPYSSMVTYIVFLTGPLTFFILLMHPDRETWIKTAITGLLTAITLLGLWGIIQYLFLDHIFGARARHPFLNANNLAALLNLGFLPATALFFTTKTRSRFYWLLWAAALILFGGIVATQSRGALLSAIIAGTIMLLGLRGQPGMDKQRFALFILSLLAVFAAMVLSKQAGNISLRLIPLLSDISQDAPLLSRRAIWANALEMARDHFWLGTGFGTFYLYYAAYRKPGFDDSTGQWAHMDPLQFLVEMGIAAPLLFYALALTVLIRTIQATRNMPKASPQRAQILGFFAALLALLLHTHVDFHLYVMPILITTGVWLAAWYQLCARAVSRPSFAPISLAGWQKPFMVLVTLAVTFMIGAMALSSALGTHYLLKAQESIRNKQASRFVRYIEAADRWGPRTFIDPEVNLAGLYIDLLNEGGAALFTAEEQQYMFTQAQEMLDSAALLNPPWAEVDHKRALLYKTAPPSLAPTGLETAQIYWEAALQKDPMHFRARENLARLYIGQGHVDKAYTLLEKGLQYPHTVETGQNFLALIAGIEELVTIKRAYDIRRKHIQETAKEETAP